MTTERTPRDDLLVGGLYDWADAGWALESARLPGETDPAALRDLTLELIADVLRSGLMVPGDVVGDEHVPWHGSADDAARRITCEWLDVGGRGPGSCRYRVARQHRRGRRDRPRRPSPRGRRELGLLDELLTAPTTGPPARTTARGGAVVVTGFL